MFNDYLKAHQFKVISVKKGETIYEPGQQPKYVYFIQSGEVRMITVNDDNDQFIQGVFKANTYFGEPALLLQRPYLAFTIAAQDSMLTLVDRPAFLRFLEEDRAFSMNLIETLSDRLFYKSMMLEEVANEQAEHRLSTLISYLSRNLESGAALQVTRQALADMSGLRVETVIRAVKKLAETGELRLVKGKMFKM